MIGATVAALVFHRWFFPQWPSEFMDESTDLAGIFLILSGFLIRIIARGYKSQLSRQSDALVTEGIYRLTRNPMYFGTFLIGMGAVLAVLHWWMFAFFLAAFLAIYLPQMRKEEQWLLKHFGETYRQYCQTTPKFFPRWNVLISRLFRKEFVFKWRWFRAELSALILTLGIVFTIEVWEDVRLFGIRELLEEGFELLLMIVAVVAIWLMISAVLKKTKIS